MKTDLQAVQTWFFDQLAQRLAEVFEAMAGVRPEVRKKPGAAETAAVESGLNWRQAFHGTPGNVWIHASQKDWSGAGNQILRAAGIEDADEAMLRSTWTETLGQALSGIAQDFSGRVGHEVTCAAGAESTESGPAPSARFAIQMPGEAAPFAEIACAIEEVLLDSLVSQPAQKTAAAAVGGSELPGSGSNQGNSNQGSAAPSGLTSKTFDLLLDVELPVSVSFGRAQVPLKDVIKLTTGAIVELNRSISEPVEVIVNNCVIARGEVVVVEGNFGVRIREVISRQDRLRTLN